MKSSCTALFTCCLYMAGNGLFILAGSDQALCLPALLVSLRRGRHRCDKGKKKKTLQSQILPWDSNDFQQVAEKLLHNN